MSDLTTYISLLGKRGKEDIRGGGERIREPTLVICDLKSWMPTKVERDVIQIISNFGDYLALSIDEVPKRESAYVVNQGPENS